MKHVYIDGRMRKNSVNSLSSRQRGTLISFDELREGFCNSECTQVSP